MISHPAEKSKEVASKGKELAGKALDKTKEAANYASE